MRSVVRCSLIIAEIKDDAWAHKADLRYSADEQIRRRYDAMLGDCPLPRLWGLSLLGTSLRVCCGTGFTETIEPDFVPRPSPSRILPRGFLEGAWAIDILSPEGFNKMKEIRVCSVTRMRAHSHFDGSWIIPTHQIW